ncbi:hypothetical protein B0O80DRAFT_456576 [Mortierella sp. GBAus27b]|nr:hypothetical protein B0O80DRAFT_456576 [Mortierella sp. GBAus27b]
MAAALPRMLEGRIPGAVPTHGSASSFQTHQSGMLPPTGPLYLPGTQNNTVAQQQTPAGYGPGLSPLQQQQPLPPLYIQQPPQPMQQPLQQQLAQSITAPASQPYFYQPGTGLVSVPLKLPPAQTPLHQPSAPMQQQMYQQPPFAYQATPGPSGNGSYHQPLSNASHVPPPYHLSQAQTQQSAPFQSATPLPTSSVPTSSTSQGRATTPNDIFLPGDSSRPLLGQGLFKIVPDAEDEEEAKRATRSAAGAGVSAPSSGGATSSGVPLDMNMKLGGDLLSSVITYENQDDRFRALERERENQTQGLTTYNGSMGGDKEELDESYQYHQPAPRNASQEIVIVGSDIVLEPLPSARAAAAKAAATSSQELETTVTMSTEELESGTTLAQSLDGPHHVHKSSVSSFNGTGAERPSLSRHATIGVVLPTMGTEENLERIDDKEEYSIGIHGDQRSQAGSSSAPSSRSAIVHPPTRTQLGRAAQGDILAAAVNIPSPPLGNFAVTEETLAILPTEDSPTASVPAAVPPPLARSTKPKLG